MASWTHDSSSVSASLSSLSSALVVGQAPTHLRLLLRRTRLHLAVHSPRPRQATTPVTSSTAAALLPSTGGSKKPIYKKQVANIREEIYEYMRPEAIKISDDSLDHDQDTVHQRNCVEPQQHI